MVLDLEGGVGWVVNHVMLVVHQAISQLQVDMDEFKGQRATLQTNNQSQSLKVSECKKIKKKAIIKQSKEKEHLETRGFIRNEIQIIVTTFKIEMLDPTHVEEPDFLITMKIWLPHVINLWDVDEAQYQQVASIEQAQVL